MQGVINSSNNHERIYIQLLIRIIIMDYNRRKVSILKQLLNGWHTADQIYNFSKNKPKTSIFSIRMALLRYYRQGLLNRRKTGRHREYEYRISKRGIERLQWIIKEGNIKRGDT